jgi:hypothetical protein
VIEVVSDYRQTDAPYTTPTSQLQTAAQAICPLLQGLLARQFAHSASMPVNAELSLQSLLSTR